MAPGLPTGPSWTGWNSSRRHGARSAAGRCTWSGGAPPGTWCGASPPSTRAAGFPASSPGTSRCTTSRISRSRSIQSPSISPWGPRPSSRTARSGRPCWPPRRSRVSSRRSSSMGGSTSTAAWSTPPGWTPPSSWGPAASTCWIRATLAGCRPRSGRWRVGGRVADWHDADRREVLRDAQRRPDEVHALWMWKGPREPGGQAFIDRRQDDQHHRAADVQPPVGNGPGQLFTVLQLVGLLVALVVELLADAGHELGTALADPTVVTNVRVPRLVRTFGHSRHERWVHHDQRAAGPG